MIVLKPGARFYCLECDETFTHKADLLKHGESHKIKKLLTCKFCPRTYVQYCQLRTHMEKFHSAPLEAKKNTEQVVTLLQCNDFTEENCGITDETQTTNYELGCSIQTATPEFFSNQKNQHETTLFSKMASIKETAFSILKENGGVMDEMEIEDTVLKTMLVEEGNEASNDRGSKDNNAGTEESGSDISDIGSEGENKGGTGESSDSNEENNEGDKEKGGREEKGGKEEEGGTEDNDNTEPKVYTDEDLTCKICLVTFKEKKYIDVHNDLIHESFHGMCPAVNCKQSFIKRTEMDAHVSKVHKKSKEFKCRDCTEKFSSFKMFVKHEVMHFRPVINRKKVHALCEICSRVMLKSHLGRHRRQMHDIHDPAYVYRPRTLVNSEL